MQRSLALCLGIYLSTIIGCDAQESTPISERAQADFVNGGFEVGNLSGWTVGTNINRGITTFPPTTIANLGLRNGGTNLTFVRSGATGSQIPAGLTAAESLRFPRAGNSNAVVNELGKNRNSNNIVQTMTPTTADVDATDGNIHVRFALAPVLQNPGHTDAEQPYFFIELRNTTKDLVLYSSFNFSGQSGIPWKEDATKSIQYTDWQLVDVAPGQTGIAIGDTLRMEVIASGCSQGAHWGEIYVDGFGAFLPGLTIVGSAPQSANAGTDLTYTFVAKNNDSMVANSVAFANVLPANTTFVSASGATCTTPAVGSPGSVSCILGALNPGASMTFQMTVHIAPAATGIISNGSYTIQGAGVAPILGPLIKTNITSGVTYTDLSITVNDGVAGATWGTPLTYHVVAKNNGPSAVTGATISNTLPAQLTGVTWTCAGSLGGVCGAGSGTGALNAAANLPVGGYVTYTIMGNVISGSGTGTLSFQASVAPPVGITDSSGNNDSAVDTDSIGTTILLTVAKSAGTGLGSVTSSPAAIQCGPACNTQSSTFLQGAPVTLTAIAAPGSMFTGWGGACSAQGTSAQCTLTPGADTSVTVNFTALPTYIITVQVPSGNGTISCISPIPQGQTSDCTVTATTPGYGLTGLTLDGNNILGTVLNNVFHLSNVTAPHTVIGTFTGVQSYTLTVRTTNGNGTITCPTMVFDGQDANCTVSPNSGFSLTSLTLDGVDIVNTVSGNAFTIPNIQAAHEIVGSFLVPAPSYPIFVLVGNGNGKITCPARVPKGQDANCTITPDPGYVLETLELDGTDSLGIVADNAFTISNMQGPHDVTGSFKKGNGILCDDASECHSGFCTTGVCCDLDCTGNACQSCTVPGLAGTCSSTCGAYGCNTAQNACYDTCTTSAECSPGGVCTNGTCLPAVAGPFMLNGGGFFGCEYGGPGPHSTSLELAGLAMLACLTLRRRVHPRSAA